MHLLYINIFYIFFQAETKQIRGVYITTGVCLSWASNYVITVESYIFDNSKEKCDIIYVSVGDSPSGKAVGSGPTIRGFESLIPSHALCEGLFYSGLGPLVRIPHPQPCPLRGTFLRILAYRS